MANSSSAVAPLNGAKVHYRRFGPVDSAKPGLILIHGMWAHCRWWDHIAPHFCDRYNVVAIDLPGMGGQRRSIQIYGQRARGERACGHARRGDFTCHSRRT